MLMRGELYLAGVTKCTHQMLFMLQAIHPDMEHNVNLPSDLSERQTDREGMEMAYMVC